MDILTVLFLLFLNTSMINIWIDQNYSVGAVAKVRASYDFTGDGFWDRNDTWENLSPDPMPGFELFQFINPALRFPLDSSITGSRTYQPLVNGTVLFTLWTGIPPHDNATCPMFIRTGNSVDVSGTPQFSTLKIPYVVHVYQKLPDPSVLPVNPNGATTGCSSLFPTAAPPTTGSITTGSPSNSVGTGSKGFTQSNTQSNGQSNGQTDVPTDSQVVLSLGTPNILFNLVLLIAILVLLM